METSPFLKCLFGILVVFLGIPLEHIRDIFQADTAAKRLNRFRRLVKHVIRVDNADLDPGVVSVRDCVIVVARCDARSDQVSCAQIVESPAQLVVPCFGGVVVVEPCHLVQRGDRAAVVRGDAEMGITNEESEMESREDLVGYYGGISWFWVRWVRIGLLFGVDAVLMGGFHGIVVIVTN